MQGLGFYGFVFILVSMSSLRSVLFLFLLRKKEKKETVDRNPIVDKI